MRQKSGPEKQPAEDAIVHAVWGRGLDRENERLG